MAMTPTRVVLTYRDYAALPADGRRYEIHEGELSVTAAPRTKHQEVSIKLSSALHVHVTARGLGKVFAAPIAVILSDISVVEPDIVYVATDRLGLISERGIEGPPTLRRRDPLDVDERAGPPHQVPALRALRCPLVLDRGPGQPRRGRGLRARRGRLHTERARRGRRVAQRRAFPRPRHPARVALGVGSGPRSEFRTQNLREVPSHSGTRS